MATSDRMRLTRQKRVSTVREEFRASMEAALDEMVVRVPNAFDSEWEAIQRNQELSVEGRSAAQRRSAGTALDRLAAFQEKTEGVLRSRIATMAGKLASVDFQRPTDAGERIAYEIRLGEIRDEVRSRTALERSSIYLRATDPLVLDAMESAPPVLENDGRTFLPFVDPERVRARRDQRARAANPELAKEMSDLEDLANAYAALIDSVRRSIEEKVEGIIDPNEMERQRARIAGATAGAK